MSGSERPKLFAWMKSNRPYPVLYYSSDIGNEERRCILNGPHIITDEAWLAYQLRNEDHQFVNGGETLQPINHFKGKWPLPDETPLTEAEQTSS